MAASLNRFLIAGWLLCLALPAHAIGIELLSDPTRPAIGISPASEAATGDTTQLPVKEGLQSVIISPQHRAAVINGITVELGGKVGDATLVEVRESSVVLQGAQGRRVLELFPGVRLKKAEAATPKEEKPAALKKKKETKNIKASEPASPGQNNKDERAGK
ncbi:MAG: hypothetical protein FD173_350 [Gallionellaceae bacterium]|nr:MAG: hypothetical protein FD173_350 [Gallionellaceae bacterium]